MTISFMGLSDQRFRLTDGTHSEEVTEASPDFKLTDGELTFRAEQLEADEKASNPGFFYYFKHFTRMFWGYFTLPTIFKECNPLLIEADVQVKNTRFREHTLVYTPSDYAPDIHDFTAPRLEGGKDLFITPTAYKVNEGEVKRRKRETFVERLGLSTFLFLLPIVFMLVSASIRAGTLTMIGIFAAVVLYPIIALVWFMWKRNCTRFEDKVRSKVIELNRKLSEPQYK